MGVDRGPKGIAEVGRVLARSIRPAWSDQDVADQDLDDFGVAERAAPFAVCSIRARWELDRGPSGT